MKENILIKIFYIKNKIPCFWYPCEENIGFDTNSRDATQFTNVGKLDDRIESCSDTAFIILKEILMKFSFMTNSFYFI